MSQCLPKEFLSAVLIEETSELMEYRHLIGNPKYRELWQNSYGNELGRLAQGMPGRVEGTDKNFLHPQERRPSPPLAEYHVWTHRGELQTNKGRPE